MARCICSGISTSLISTTLTSTPQGSVSFSMMSRRSAFKALRWASTVSRSTRPRTDLNVVCAIWEVAIA